MRLPSDEGMDQARLEMAILGSLLIGTNVDAALETTGVTTAADFMDMRHGMIFQCCADILLSGGTLDVLTVADCLAASGDLRRVGGPAYLDQCIQSCPVTANGPWYAGLLHKRAGLARLGVAGRQVIEISESAFDLDQAIAGAGQVIQAVSDQINGQRPPAPTPLEALNTRDRWTYQTPWKSLNRAIGGWLPGQVTIVGARPGVGKSHFVVHLANYVSKAGGRVLIFSLEMSARDVWVRMIANESGVDSFRILHGNLDEHESASAQAAAIRLGRQPIILDDTPSLTVEQISSRVRREQLAGQVDLVLIDFLNIIQGDRRQDRRLEVEGVALRLQAMARTTGIPIVVMAQLNRGAADIPTMESLRETGAIEQIADVIVLLATPNKRDTGDLDPDRDPNLLVMNLDKNRRGLSGLLEMQIHPEYSRIIDS